MNKIDNEETPHLDLVEVYRERISLEQKWSCYGSIAAWKCKDEGGFLLIKTSINYPRPKEQDDIEEIEYHVEKDALLNNTARIARFMVKFSDDFQARTVARFEAEKLVEA